MFTNQELKNLELQVQTLNSSNDAIVQVSLHHDEIIHGRLAGHGVGDEFLSTLIGVHDSTVKCISETWGCKDIKLKKRG